MTYYLHIDGKPIADFHDKEWAMKIVSALHKWEKSIDHLPHRDFIPARHYVLTDKHTGEVAFDSAFLPEVMKKKSEAND